MRISFVANYIKELFGIKSEKDNLTIEEIIAKDYYECICYLYKGKEKPIIKAFKDGVNIWLNTSVGIIELDNIPHDKEYLTNNINELEVLIDENGFEEEFIIALINREIDKNWKYYKLKD